MCIRDRVCIYIPLLLALPRVWGMNGLMAAMPLADALGFLEMCIRDRACPKRSPLHKTH